MEIKPEDYVKKLKEISAKYSDADLITDVKKKGYAFDPEKRVRCLCFYCLEDIDREACGECFGKGILFVTLNSGRGYRQSNLLKPSVNPINEMTSSEYLEYHEFLLSLYPESLDKSKWEPCANHNEARCNCMVSRQVRPGLFAMPSLSRLSRGHLEKIEAGRAIRNRAKMVETAVKRPSISPSGMPPLEFLEYYEQKIKEHPDKAGGAWSLCLDHGYENCACSGSEEGEDSGFVHMGTAESPVVISQNKRLAEGRALRESNRISEELIKHAKDQTKVPYKIAYPTSEIRMNPPSPKATTVDRVNKIATALDSIADDTMEASMRAAASQFVKLTREPLVAALTSGLGMEDNATSRAKVAKFLKSPLGDALVSGMLSAGVASLPVRADLKSGIAKELRVRAMGTAMDEAADLFMEPFRTVTAQLISGQTSIGLLDSGERETLNLEAKVEERVEA